MSIFDWNNNYETGLDIIDFQHKILFSRLVELEKALQKNESKQKIKRILSDLISYALKHFKTEEDFFGTFEYKEKELHMKEHQAYRDYIYYISEKFLKSNENITVNEILNLKDRVFQHITVIDKEFVNELKKYL